MSSSSANPSSSLPSWTEWAGFGAGRSQTEVARLTSSALGEAVFDPAVFTWLSEATADRKPGALALAIRQEEAVTH